jgi:hypothetical protein
MPSEIEFVTATQKLAEQYFGGRPPYGFRGYIALLDGEPVGIGGLFMWDGIPVVFTQMKDPMRPFIKARAKAVRLMVGFMDTLKVSVYATADKMEPTSDKLLAKLGFVPTGVDTEHGELLVRRR